MLPNQAQRTALSAAAERLAVCRRWRRMSLAESDSGGRRERVGKPALTFGRPVRAAGPEAQVP